MESCTQLLQEPPGTEPSQLDYKLSLEDNNEQEENEESRLIVPVKETVKAWSSTDPDEYMLDDLQQSYLSASVQDEPSNLGQAMGAFPQAVQTVIVQDL